MDDYDNYDYGLDDDGESNAWNWLWVIIPLFFLLIILPSMTYRSAGHQMRMQMYEDLENDYYEAERYEQGINNIQQLSNKNPEIICSYNHYNCEDFSNCLEVMEVFNECSSDIHYLDGNEDGVPCEELCG